IAVDLPAAIDGAPRIDGVRYIAADVTNPDQVGTAVTAADGPPLRTVVNCAGIAPSARILGKDGSHDLGLFSKVVQINLIGTFTVMALAAEAMAATEPL